MITQKIVLELTFEEKMLLTKALRKQWFVVESGDDMFIDGWSKDEEDKYQSRRKNMKSLYKKCDKQGINI